MLISAIRRSNLILSFRAIGCLSAGTLAGPAVTFAATAPNAIFEWNGRFKADSPAGRPSSKVLNWIKGGWNITIEAKLELDTGGLVPGIDLSQRYYSIQSVTVEIPYQYLAYPEGSQTRPISETSRIVLDSSDFELDYSLTQALNPNTAWNTSWVVEQRNLFAKGDYHIQIFLKCRRQRDFYTPKGAKLTIGGGGAGVKGGFNIMESDPFREANPTLWPDGSDFLSPSGYRNAVYGYVVPNSTSFRTACKPQKLEDLYKTVRFLDEEDDSRIVVGAIADGRSRVTVEIGGVTNSASVSIPDEDGTWVSDPTIQNGVWRRVWQAPESYGAATVDEEAGDRPVEFSAVIDGQQVAPQQFSLHKTPVLLLHGLWDNGPQCWKYFEPQLNANGFLWTSSPSYPNDLPFTNNKDVVSKKAGELLMRVRDQGLVAKKVDVVGHSMGGCLTMFFGQPEYIRRIVTIGTPYYGSKSADHILKNNLEGLVLRWVLQTAMKRSVDGAVRDLRTANLQNIGRRVGVPSLAISVNSYQYAIPDGFIPNAPPPDVEISSARWVFGYLLLQASQLTVNFDPKKTYANIFGEDSSDWTVSTYSQAGGFSGNQLLEIDARSKPGLWHCTETRSEDVWKPAIEFLKASLDSPTIMASSLPDEAVVFSNLRSSAALLAEPQPSIDTNNISFTAPAKGTICTAGGVVNIRISCPPNTRKAILSVIGGPTIVDQSHPFEGSVTIPQTALGELAIVAVTVNDSGGLGAALTTVNVNTTASVTNLNIWPDSVVYLNEGDKYPLMVEGIFSDGVPRWINGSQFGTRYQSTKPSIATVSSNGEITALGSGFCEIEISNGPAKRTLPVQVVPGSSPTISEQPRSQNVALGAQVAFNVDAHGASPLRYQWRFNNSTIAKATNATLSITNVQKSHAGNYTIVVKNNYGSVTSAVATLTVTVPPKPTPPSGVQASDGLHADKTVVGWNAVTGATGYEVWRGATAKSNAATRVASVAATPTSYDDTAAKPGVTNYYWIKAKNGAGTSSFSLPDPGYTKKIILLPPRQIYASDGLYPDKVLVAWNVCDGATLYEVWRSSTARTNSATRIGTSAALRYEDTTALAGKTNYYWVKAKNNFSSMSGFSPGDSGYRRYDPPKPAAITQPPTNQTVSEGSDVTFTVGATGAPPPVYRWRFNGKTIAGATNASLFLRNVKATNAGAYSVLVSNKLGNATASAQLTVRTNKMVTTVKLEKAAEFLSDDWVNDVFVSGNLAYVADYNFTIADIKDPRWPKKLGAGQLWFPDAVQVIGNYAYLATEGLTIADISQSTQPKIVGRYLGPSLSDEIAVSGYFAYVAYLIEGLEVIDIRNKAMPKFVTQVSTNMVSAVFADDDRLYFTDLQGLKIYDISNPALPKRLAAHAAGGLAEDLLVADNRVYLASLSDGLIIVDISTPSQPKLVSTTRTGGSAWGVDVVNDLAFVAAGSNGLEVINISDPRLPRWVAGFKTPHANKVQVAGDYAYVADREGLFVISVTQSQSPASPNDLDGDGRTDLLVQHTDGRLGAWLMNGAQFIHDPLLDPVSPPSGFSAKVLGDFDQDGRPDLLFQSRSGLLHLWSMDGLRMHSQNALTPPNPGPGWVPMAVADIDRDGQTDVIFQQANSETAVWLLNGRQLRESRWLNPTAPQDRNYRLAGAGDFNADGKVDLVWQHAQSGELAVWLMDGSMLSAGIKLTPPTPSLAASRVVAVADFNRDGRPDLVFKYQGSLTLWLMNGTVRQAEVPMAPGTVLATGWNVIGPK